MPRRSRWLTCRVDEQRLEPLVDFLFDESSEETSLLDREDHLRLCVHELRRRERGPYHHPVGGGREVERLPFVTRDGVPYRHVPEDRAALLGVDVEALPCHRHEDLEVRDQLVRFGLIFEFHVEGLSRVVDVPQGRGSLLVDELLREVGEPEELGERTDVFDVAGGPLDHGVPQNELLELLVIHDIPYGPAREREARECPLIDVGVHLLPHLREELLGAARPCLRGALLGLRGCLALRGALLGLRGALLALHGALSLRCTLRFSFAQSPSSPPPPVARVQPPSSPPRSPLPPPPPQPPLSFP